MPLYEYFCPECERDFEQRMPIAEADQAACPNCGSAQTKRRLARVALQLQSVSSSSFSDVGSVCDSSSCCGGTCGFDNLN